ncbi:MAG TPA: transposase, partial [Rubrobacteraceae bacterium]|nr:transposase [Rubrobacteraceae bacterium]
MTSAARTSGSPRCARGRRRAKRARGSAPRNRGKNTNTTLLASLGAVGMGPSLPVESGTTEAVFEAYVERVLAPSLPPWRVVVMDNLSAHEGERVRELLRARGCEVLFSAVLLAGLLADRG